jgi:signal transduction histidine kinase
VEHRKRLAWPQAGPKVPLNGDSTPKAYLRPAEPETHGTLHNVACRTAMPRARKRLVTRLYRWASHATSTLANDRALLESKSELRRLSAQLLAIQEKERQRIASDLHDGIGQSLSLIKLSLECGFQLLESGEQEKGHELLRSIVPKLDAAIAELRRTTSDLRPPMLDDLGIIATLSWFFRELGPVCNGKRIEKDVTVTEGDVPMPVKAAIFRILQEAMNNVLKHANADLVRVCLKKSDGEIRFSIEDNGQGFDRETTPGCRRCGFGLLTMKERAISCGGTLEVESARGRGTRIAAAWPLATAAKPVRVDVPRKATRPQRAEHRPPSGGHRHTHRVRGFVALALLGVMVIIGPLAGYVGPKYFAQIGTSQLTTARARIDALGAGPYPSTEQGLRALVTRP